MNAPKNKVGSWIDLNSREGTGEEAKLRSIPTPRSEMAMAAGVEVRKTFFFPVLILVLIITSCLTIKVDQETKAFIRLVIENSKKEASFLCNGPVSAIPRGTRVRNIVGSSPKAFLVPDVLVWDPLSHFPDKILLCPSCNDKTFKRLSILSVGKMVVTSMTNHDSCMAFEMMYSLLAECTCAEISIKSSVMIFFKF